MSENLTVEKFNELEELVNDLGSQLASNFYQTIQILSTISTFTENFYEGSHSRFVSEKSAQLAEELGLNDEDVMEIKIAGLLHDIGKIGFLDSSLFKYPNEMSSTEYKKYSMHPELGTKILEPHPNFKSISEIILHHHEKLDGSGFPNHYQADRIHPGAKILIVVDTYHNALFKKQRNRANTASSSMPYTSSAAFIQSTQNRYSNVMNYLNKKAGVLFDKKVVARFIRMMEFERSTYGDKSVLRIPVNKIETGMVFAEDYFTSFGMLIAAKGETITSDMVRSLLRFAESGEIPYKILVMK